MKCSRKEFLAGMAAGIAALGLPGFARAAEAPVPSGKTQPASSTARVEIEWLGHGSFKFVSPRGKVILLDPWISTNPKVPTRYRDGKGFGQVDLIVFTHGHVDHFMLPDVKKLVKLYDPDIIAPWELDFFIKSEIPQARCMTFRLANIGATLDYHGIDISMVNAVHSSGAQLTGFSGTNKYMGRPVGYVFAFENGTTVYHSGDTALMSDMELVIGAYYKPDIAILPIGNVFTMGPKEAAYACKMIRPSIVIPEHYATFPALEQTADRFVQALAETRPETRALVLKPGQPTRL
jgi:L-ascorbate metabolism protein UlaG (beta-lactamase superfamily)